MSRPVQWVLAAAGADPDGGDPVGLVGADRVGGKAYNLARLERFGQPVPEWYAVTTDAFREVLARAGLDRRIAERLAHPPSEGGASEGDAREGGWSEEEAARIQAEIRRLPVPPELEAAVAEAHARRIGGAGGDGDDSPFVAVRSSAAGEDAAGASFAGLHDSFLFVRGPEALWRAIRGVWASAYNPRALAYRASRGLPLDDIAVGVVVQRMVDAEVSGVMFTVDPTRGDLHRVVVSALFGLGEGLVSAGLDADTWTVDKSAARAAERAGKGELPAVEGVTRGIADKEERMVLDEAAGGGLRREPLPAELRSRPSLDDQRLYAVVTAGFAIETAFRRPQDVEFCFDRDGRLFVLQSRPVTAVEEDGPAAGNPLLWDNSNIIESYSGVTSPMTFSFIRHAYTIVYHCFAEVMGIPPRTVRANRSTFHNMLGLFRGQVYYNLHNWYRLVRLFPGFGYNREFMESMMGVRESTDLTGADADLRPASWRRRYLVELPALLRLVGRSLWNFLRIRRIVGRFEEHFRTCYARWTALDLRSLPPHELKALYEEMERELLWQWKAPIINDFFVMIFYGLLKRLCERWCGDETGSLQNDLVCGEGGIESTEPTKMLLELARRARRDEALRRHLLATPPAELAVEMPHDPRFAEFYAEVGRYLDLYGFRCIDELKLEEPSLHDRPDFVYQVLANYLARDDGEILDATAAEERERTIRRQAERRAFRSLGRLRRAVFRRVLANARLGVKNRENLRFARTRIYGLLRQLLRACGEQLAAEGLLETTEDVFYLTLDELWDFVQGAAVTTDLRGLVVLRRREFDRFREDRDAFPDDRFETYGLPYHRNRFESRPAADDTEAAGGLRGTGCCPGVVTGPVKVLASPADDASLAGEILVAERTDPGWVPLYPAISGLLIERGSILSHSAIVAREMGIPTIVGIRGLSAALATGDEVTMDGSTGVVTAAAEDGDEAAGAEAGGWGSEAASPDPTTR